MPIPADYHMRAPRTAKERVYAAVREWIIDGTLKPGERLNDKEIAGHFSVSRTPVREAFQMLAEQRLIQVFPGRESRVAPVDEEQAWENYQLLADLHADAVRFAFAKITPEDIEALRRYHGSLQKAAGDHDVADMLRYDHEFHQVFVKRAGHYFLGRFIGTLEAQVTRVERMYFDRYPTEETIRDHEKIIASTERKEMETACAQTRENWLHTLQVLKE